MTATETTISLAWETSNRACVKQFEISVTATGTEQTAQRLKDQSDYTFPKVWPCRTYNVTLYTVNNESAIVNKDSELTDTLYLEPGELSLTISNRSNGDTRITWSEPDNNSCIRSYSFVWRRNDCKQDEDEETTTTAVADWDVTSTTDQPGSETEVSEEPSGKYYPLSEI